MYAVLAPTVRPIPERLGDEPRAIVGTNVSRDAPRDEQLAQGFDDIARLELPRDTDGQALGFLR
jgi:hypothetical protein